MADIVRQADVGQCFASSLPGNCLRNLMLCQLSFRPNRTPLAIAQSAPGSSTARTQGAKPCPCFQWRSHANGPSVLRSSDLLRPGDVFAFEMDANAIRHLAVVASPFGDVHEGEAVSATQGQRHPISQRRQERARGFVLHATGKAGRT